MSLLPELNEEQTIKNAVSRLENYKRLVQLANNKYVPKVTATYSFEPRNKTNIRNESLEKHTLTQIQATAKLEQYVYAIESIADVYVKQVIIETYCKNFGRQKLNIYMDLCIEEYDYYRLLRKGHLAFAENFDNGKLQVYEDGMTVNDFINSL